MSKTRPTLLILGCGGVGLPLARAWQGLGARVIGSYRSAAGRENLQAAGIEGCYLDLDLPESLANLPSGIDILYHLVPPSPGGEEDGRTANLLAALSGPHRPRQLIYISTSGVYGDSGGDWVDEETPPRPQAPRARRRYSAERQLMAWAAEGDTTLTRLRVGGIYGPGRLPRRRLEEGKPVLREEESGYSNRIHIDDLIAICIVAAQQGKGGLFNVSDGHPGTMTGYFNAVAAALGLPLPSQITMAEARKRLSPAMLSYLCESRRLDNRKMVRELGITLRYPDLAHGLAALVESAAEGVE